MRPAPRRSIVTAMTDFTSFAPPDTRRLERRPDDKVVAGVCAALGRQTNTDPVLWRVSVAVLAVFGGSGILLYLLGWLLLPAAGSARSPAERAIRPPGGRIGVRGVILAVLATLVLLASLDSGPGLVGLAVIAGVGYLVQRDRHRAKTVPPTPFGAPVAPWPGYGPAAGWGAPTPWTGEPSTPSGAAPPPPWSGEPAAPTGATLPSQPATAEPAAPSVDPAQYDPAHEGPAHEDAAQDGPAQVGPAGTRQAPLATAFAGSGQQSPASSATEGGGSVRMPLYAPPLDSYAPPFAYAGVAPAPYGGVAPAAYGGVAPSPYGGELTYALAHNRPLRRPRSALGLFTLSVALVISGALAVLGLLGLEAVTAPRVLAVALLIVGVGLVAGTWVGRARWLVAPGLVLLLALGATSGAERLDVPLEGGQGPSSWELTPASTVTDFRLGAGEAVLDLRRAPTTTQRVLSARVGIGELTVLVPAGLTVEIRPDIGLGQVREEGDAVADRGAVQDGPNLNDVLVVGPPGTPDVILNVNIRAGELEVRHVPA